MTIVNFDEIFTQQLLFPKSDVIPIHKVSVLLILKLTYGNSFSFFIRAGTIDDLRITFI